MNKSMKFVLGGLALLCSSQDVLGNKLLGAKYDLVIGNDFVAAIQQMTGVNNTTKYVQASKAITGKGSNVRQNLIGKALSDALTDMMAPTQKEINDAAEDFKNIQKEYVAAKAENTKVVGVLEAVKAFLVKHDGASGCGDKTPKRIITNQTKAVTELIGLIKK